VVTAGPVRQLRETDIIFQRATIRADDPADGANQTPRAGEPGEPRYLWALCAVWMACRGATRPQHDA